jgi:hypothetical protein
MTLGSAAAAGVRLIVWCRECGHQVEPHSAGNDKARDALKALTEAVVNDTSIGDAQKNELIDQITFLSEQTVAAAKDRKPGLIKATFSALTEAAHTVTSMAGAWRVAEPILRSLFG